MTNYDAWLEKQADEYYGGCEPKVVSVHLEPQDGEIAREPIYNCEDCDCSECEHWSDFHDPEDLLSDEPESEAA